MAKAAHASSDIWHHSLEDLLKAIETGDTAGSPASFAITLQTSTAPIGTPVAAFPRFDRLHIYQLTHLASDRSARFQLRLGIIESDLEADAILATVRTYYPQAIKATVNEADRTAIAQAVSTAKTKAVVVPPPKVSPAPAVASPVPKAAPKAEVPAITDDARWNIDELLPELATPSQQGPARLPRNAPAAQLHQKPPSGLPQPPVLKAATVPETPAKAVAVQVPAAPARQEEPRKPIASPGPPMAPVRAASVPSVIRPPLAVGSKPPNSELPTPAPQPRRIGSAASAARGATPDGRAPALPASGVQDLRAEGAKSIQPMIRAAPVPAPTSTSDSGTLQSLVDKIDTLIYAVELRAEQRTVAQKLSTPGPVPVASATVPTAAASVASKPPSVNTQANTRNIQRAPAAIDSTQTIRALTAVELEDAEASQWFVVELMQSQGQIEPEQIPKLDIFAEYRLYSVSETETGVPIHLLRLGFFSSEIAAYAVAGYLSAHFPAKQIKRVSIAERDRFAEQALEAKKEVGEAGRHTVIEVTALPEITNTPAPLAARSAGEGEARADAPSLWSRLTRFRG